MSSSCHMLSKSLVWLLFVTSLTLISCDVVSFILITEPRYLNVGTDSTSVSSIRTEPVSFRAIIFVFTSLIFRTNLSLCLFTPLTSFLNSSFDICIKVISSPYSSFHTFWGHFCSNTIVGFNLYVQAGAVNRKKKKPKMKSYTRRVPQSSTGNEELLTPGSGKGKCSV